MTIGEKIKYFRERSGITQSRLAELSGIHPVSIRKYETNKMQPQLPQIERIASALGVSSLAFTGIDNLNIRLDTVGDLMGVMMLLCKSKILIIDGERDAESGYKPDTVSFKFNPKLASVLKSNVDSMISYVLNNRAILNDFLRWEKINYLYEKSAAEADSTSDEDLKNITVELGNAKEIVELELQRSIERL